MKLSAFTIVTLLITVQVVSNSSILAPLTSFFVFSKDQCSRLLQHSRDRWWRYQRFDPSYSRPTIGDRGIQVRKIKELQHQEV